MPEDNVSKHPKWVYEFIDIKSNIEDDRSNEEIAKKIKMSRQGIYQYLRSHPEVYEVIAGKLERETNKLKSAAHKALYAQLKRNPQALKMALEMIGAYKPSSEVTNIYQEGDAEAKRKRVRALVDNILSTKDKDIDK